jgi:hypothetical protein
MRQLSAVIFFIFLLVISCEKKVELRKFPYPYKAAFTICSDIDNTETLEELIEIHNKINETDTDSSLGLEIGDSFWLYNELNEFRKSVDFDETKISSFFSSDEPDYGISYYDGLSDSLSNAAKVINRYIKMGVIDCLHSFGHFSFNTFDRNFAIRALDELQKESLLIDVFTNHGGPENTHNIGTLPSQLGDNPSKKEYHSDLLLNFGIKFLWSGQITHCIGQDGKITVENSIKQLIEFLQDFKANHEVIWKHDNKLVQVITLDDGQKIFDFVRYINRWGKHSIADEPFIYFQIGPAVINELISNQGYMIQYTHLGANNGAPYISEPTFKALRYISHKSTAGELWVTSTSKLLNYYIHHKYLNWKYLVNGDTIEIFIESITNEVEGTYIPTINELKGVTFYIPQNKNIRLYLNKKEIGFVKNPKDYKEKYSITIRCN